MSETSYPKRYATFMNMVVIEPPDNLKVMMEMLKTELDRREAIVSFNVEATEAIGNLSEILIANWRAGNADAIGEGEEHEQKT